MDWKRLRDNSLLGFKIKRWKFKTKKKKKYKSKEKLSPKTLAEFQKHYQAGTDIPDNIQKEIKIYTRSFTTTKKRRVMSMQKQRPRFQETAPANWIKAVWIKAVPILK